MCRWLAYIGDPVTLHTLLFDSKHSLVIQSLNSTEGAEATNGDGFGVGWYSEYYDDEPALFRSVEPAWNDRNLKDICRHVQSRCVLAHVRAASPGLASIQQTNCHPFRYKDWLFMHNGAIRIFRTIKRELTLAIDPDLFPFIEGSTDSEVFFYLALTFGLQDDPPAAVAKAVHFIDKVGRENGSEKPIQMTIACTNGNRLWAFRYSSEGSSRTLYYSSDKKTIEDMYTTAPGVRASFLTRLAKFGENSRLIVSEPMSDVPGVWNKVPESSCVYVEGSTIEITPFDPLGVE